MVALAGTGQTWGRSSHDLDTHPGRQGNLTIQLSAFACTDGSSRSIKKPAPGNADAASGKGLLHAGRHFVGRTCAGIEQHKRCHIIYLD